LALGSTPGWLLIARLHEAEHAFACGIVELIKHLDQPLNSGHIRADWLAGSVERHGHSTR
jgi:hypothetical protein